MFGHIFGHIDVSSTTLRHLVEIGRLIPDFHLPNPRGLEKMYLEKPTFDRFMRQVSSRQPLEGLIPYTALAKSIGRKASWVRNQEKMGLLQPSWFHRHPNGRYDFFFTREDYQKIHQRVHGRSVKTRCLSITVAIRWRQAPHAQ